jgi:hypothetical protein
MTILALCIYALAGVALSTLFFQVFLLFISPVGGAWGRNYQESMRLTRLAVLVVGCIGLVAGVATGLWCLSFYESVPLDSWWLLLSVPALLVQRLPSPDPSISTGVALRRFVLGRLLKCLS